MASIAIKKELIEQREMLMFPSMTVKPHDIILIVARAWVKLFSFFNAIGMVFLREAGSLINISTDVPDY